MTRERFERLAIALGAASPTFELFPGDPALISPEYDALLSPYYAAEAAAANPGESRREADPAGG